MPNRGRDGLPSPEPTAVWLVRPGSPDAIPGRLSIEGAILRFAGNERLDVPVSDIRRTRRRRSAPILEISYGEDHTLFLYFAEPPPLPERRADTRPRFPSHGLERAASAMQLRGEAKLLRRAIEEWMKAIRKERDH